MTTVNDLVAGKPVVIFSKSTCGMSHSIKSLITNFGANIVIYELDEIPNGQQIEGELRQLGCQPSVPTVYIGQRFIGGAERVFSLQVRNELVPLLKRAKAIWV